MHIVLNKISLRITWFNKIPEMFKGLAEKNAENIIKMLSYS